jgi:hypothetical protein
MSGETDVRLVDPAPSVDDRSTVHLVCCHEWLPAGGPTLCGVRADDPSPVVDGDQDCVVCVDLATADPTRCPRYGRCNGGAPR